MANRSLVERLGYAPGAKLLIINCDDLGSSHGANRAIRDGLRSGEATSATLMMPCPAASEALEAYQGEPVGVHLTLTAEWEAVSWGPLTDGASLLDARGSLPRTVDEVWATAKIDDVRRECVAQIEAALEGGVDVTHLDSHMGTLQAREDFFEIYVELAARYALPLRMLGASLEPMVGFSGRAVAEARGIVFPDHFVYSNVGSRAAIEQALAELGPGVTEVYVHPSIDSPELRATHPDWEGRIDDYAFLRSPELRNAIEAAGAELVSFAPLRELQRSASG